MSSMLKKINKKTCSIGINLAPSQSLKLNSVQANNLRGEEVKHNQNLSNLVPVGLEDIESLDCPTSASLASTLRELIMGLRAEGKDKFVVTISASWNDVLETWVKKKCKKHASTVINHMFL